MPWLNRKKTNKKTTVPMISGRKPFQKKKLSKSAYQDFIKTSKSVPLPKNFLSDKSLFFKEYFSALARYVPSVSNAIWIWLHLTSTEQSVSFSGGTDAERQMAKLKINALDSRITPIVTVQQGGMDFLVKQFFSSIFKFGRFAGNLIIDPNGNSVETFQILNPFKVRFDENLNAFYMVNNKTVPTNPNTFYYFGLGMDNDNPYGAAMIESVTPLIKIAENMITDMALSSSNAGTPRLHIKISQPDKAEFEDDEDYRIRITDYFQNTVQQFADIGPDDNIYSWGDVEISTAGGSTGSSGFVWSTNRSVIDEEIISGFHLYPWILGKSLSTTKNWVRSQFDLLMSEVNSLQREAKRFSEWIANTELLLSGIVNVKSHRSFTLMRDPAIKDIAIADRFKINNAKDKARSGFISPDDAARELGYDSAYAPGLMLKGCDTADEPINKNDNSLEDKLDTILDLIESLNLQK